MRLLTLDATVLVAPADIRALEPLAPPAAQRRRDAFGELEPVEPARPRAPTVGGDLTDAARLLREGAASLAAARVDGPLRS